MNTDYLSNIAKAITDHKTKIMFRKFSPKIRKRQKNADIWVNPSPEKYNLIEINASISEDDNSISEELQETTKLNKDLEIKESSDILDLESYEKTPWNADEKCKAKLT
jgi:hypothetical protein